MASPNQCSFASRSRNMILLGFLLLYPASGIIGFDGQEITHKPHQNHHHHSHRSQQHGARMLNQPHSRTLKVKPAWDIERGLVHMGRSSTRTITFDFVDKPKLMGAIDMMRSEICASMMDEHGKHFGSYGSCVKFMMGACKPGPDKVMDQESGEHTSKRGYCRMFFPAELSEKAKARKKEAADKKKAAAVTHAAQIQAEAEAAAAEAAEAVAKKKAAVEQAAEDAARAEAQKEAAAEAAAKARVAAAQDAEEKKQAEEEEAAAVARKKKAEAAAAAAAARKKIELAEEQKQALKKSRDRERALQKKVQEEKEMLEALEAEKEAAGAEAEAAIAEAQEQQAAVEAKLKAMVAAANAPVPAPPPAPAGMDLSWARKMDAKSELPEQGLEGPLVNHEDGDTMTEDWMQERTPASHLCAICAKSPGNPWCRGKCMKSRPQAAPEQRTVVDVVREAVGGGSSAETETSESKPIQEQPPASGDTDEPPEDGGNVKDDSTQVPPGFHPPGDIKQSSARKSSVTILGVVTSILVLFNN